MEREIKFLLCELLHVKMLCIYPLDNTCNKPGIQNLVFFHNSPTVTLISRFIVSKVLKKSALVII